VLCSALLDSSIRINVRMIIFPFVAAFYLSVLVCATLHTLLTVTSRMCGTETLVRVVLHHPALVAKVWPALLSILAGLGLNRGDTDEGTLLLSLKLPNDSIGVPTSLAWLRHVLLTTHLFL